MKKFLLVLLALLVAGGAFVVYMTFIRETPCC